MQLKVNDIVDCNVHGHGVVHYKNENPVSSLFRSFPILVYFSSGKTGRYTITGLSMDRNTTLSEPRKLKGAVSFKNLFSDEQLEKINKHREDFAKSGKHQAELRDALHMETQNNNHIFKQLEMEKSITELAAVQELPFLENITQTQEQQIGMLSTRNDKLEELLEKFWPTGAREEGDTPVSNEPEKKPPLHERMGRNTDRLEIELKRYTKLLEKLQQIF